jgi:hypothetical protein
MKSAPDSSFPFFLPRDTHATTAHVTMATTKIPDRLPVRAPPATQGAPVLRGLRRRALRTRHVWGSVQFFPSKEIATGTWPAMPLGTRQWTVELLAIAAPTLTLSNRQNARKGKKAVCVSKSARIDGV